MYKDVLIDTDEEPMLFKAQLFALTGVQPHRQKIMLRGGTLKDDGWGTMPVKDVSFFWNMVFSSPILQDTNRSQFCVLAGNYVHDDGKQGRGRPGRANEENGFHGRHGNGRASSRCEHHLKTSIFTFR
jgi:hypothetical protein